MIVVMHGGLAGGMQVVDRLLGGAFTVNGVIY